MAAINKLPQTKQQGIPVEDKFVDIRILDNFYQTSSFFPMPIVLVSTVAESGQTNLGPYSLCFPYIVAGDHSMMLISREDSNTSLNIQRTGVCALNFIPDDKKYIRNCVMLGFPGESTEEKMRNSVFTLVASARPEEERQPGVQYPEIVKEAIQVFECTWNRDYPLKQAPNSPECSFVLRVEKIVMQEKWRNRLLEGKALPRLPVGYGFRDNTYFWFTRGARPYRESIPKEKSVTVDTVRFAVERVDPDIEWQDEACARLVNVPRIFMTRVIKGCVEAAKAEGVTEITPEFLDRIRDKRREERNP
jgi:flavin reductase (DIM6/NTAB) family NADH-FMN oxidoreductase RutF